MLMTGCVAPQPYYKPAVSLGPSPHTIQTKVQLQPFIDDSPQGEADSAGGFSIRREGVLAGDLATDVTQAVLSDFSVNQVFQSVGQGVATQPDLIMKGTINHYCGKFGPNAIFWLTIPIDITWFLGVPIMDEDINVDLSVSLQRLDGTVVGNYHGASIISRCNNIYYNPPTLLPVRVNQVFSDTVSQIRSQILKDAEKLDQMAIKPEQNSETVTTSKATGVSNRLNSITADTPPAPPNSPAIENPTVVPVANLPATRPTTDSPAAISTPNSTYTLITTNLTTKP